MVKLWYKTNREYENRINEFRIVDGYSLKDLADKCDIGYTTMFLLSQGMVNPFDRKGKIKEYVLKLCILFNVEFGELFPFEVCFIKKEQKELVYSQVSDITISDYTLSIPTFEDLDRANILMEVIAALKHDKRIKVIIKRYYHNMTYAEIGEDLDITSGRVRQIENAALRKLRYPHGYKLRVYMKR